ncbi:hypothetical protein [Streptomyces decoyicus]
MSREDNPSPVVLLVLAAASELAALLVLWLGTAAWTDYAFTFLFSAFGVLVVWAFIAWAERSLEKDKTPPTEGDQMT